MWGAQIPTVIDVYVQLIHRALYSHPVDRAIARQALFDYFGEDTTLKLLETWHERFRRRARFSY